jgi:hypothetical protein
MDDVNRKTIGDYFAALALKATADWDHVPDIGLYLDQVITYLEKQIDIFRKPGEDHLITPSMVNNYAKAKIIPRTEGKKYGQEHIALLLSVFTLKRVLSVQDMAALFEGLGDAEETRDFYEHFRQSMERSAKETATEVKTELLDLLDGCEGKNITGESGPAKGNGLSDGSPKLDEKALRHLALKLAVEASLRSFAAEKLLSLADSGKSKTAKARKPKNKNGRKVASEQ